MIKDGVGLNEGNFPKLSNLSLDTLSCPADMHFSDIRCILKLESPHLHEFSKLLY
jgi:hypothetical protein